MFNKMTNEELMNVDGGGRAIGGTAGIVLPEPSPTAGGIVAVGARVAIITVGMVD